MLPNQAAQPYSGDDGSCEQSTSSGKMRGGWFKAARCGVIALALMAAEAAFAKSYILVAGRRDPRIYAIDFEAALRPENNATPNAIVNRSLVSPRRLDGVLLGDPANIVLSADQHTAYVMNHHGSIVNAEFLQHGGRANISIMTVGKILSREFDDTDKALEKIVDAGWFGGVGLISLGDRLIASSSQGWLAVDGSNRISIIDIASGGLVGQIQMALTGPGTNIAAQVTGVGIDPYGVTVIEDAE
jgi:DNA-binding beta-propeller fold protein YncE